MKKNKGLSLKHIPGWAAVLLILLTLAACGGGLGGSGDGGDADRGSDTSTLPGYLEDPYLIKSIPERLIAKIPTSLSRSDSQADPNSPYNKLNTTISELVDHKLEVGLVQLHLDSNWEKIAEHCSNTPLDTTCTLDGTTFSSLYTLEMAAWEFELRARIAQELTGSDGILSESDSAIVENLVKAKIGTQLVIDQGTYLHSSGSGYSHEVILPLDLGFGTTLYTLRWTEDQSETYMSLLRTEGVDALLLKTATSQPSSSSELTNSVLMSAAGLETREEKQLNLNQQPGDQELLIESQHTQIEGSVRTDIYSIGNASNIGGYIRSESSTRDGDDVTVTNFQREAFSGQAEIAASASCSKDNSSNQCLNDEDWIATTPVDPVQTPFFFTAEELVKLESNLKPFDIEFQGVSGDMDVLVLIRRDNLSISFGPEGITLSIPGLGQFSFNGESASAEADNGGDITTSASRFTSLADSVLCRVNKGIVDNQIDWRSFCAGTTAEIEDALVVGESFRAGRLLIEWQASAVIDVISR
ncbi:MAG: hypothetical protein KTR32_11315 [Granulosicoccus sp.]|nr:hypothetical protein [Granulosicoccus sp.]